MAGKAERIRRQVEWAQAVIDGRVVRYCGGLTFKAHATVEAARHAQAALRAAGDDSAVIVEVAQA